MSQPAKAGSSGRAERALKARHLNLVLIEGDDADARLILGELRSAGLEIDVLRANRVADVRAALGNLDGVDAVLCAYHLPDLDALAALEMMSASGAMAPFIVVNGGMSDAEAGECMRLGAADYIFKNDLGRLPHALTEAIDQAQAERDGREVLRSYRSLFENLPMAVLEATGAGQILHANAAAVGMFGFADMASLLATSILDLYVEPEERRALPARLETEGHVPEFECRIRRVDGSEFWFSRVVHAVREDDGRVVVWETIGRDITERKLAELELAKSTERLRSLLAGAPVAVTTVDRDGRCTFAGGSVFSHFGLDPKTIVGLTLSDSFADRPDFIELWTRALEDDVQTDLEYGGRSIHVRCGPYRLTPDAEIIGVLVVAFDNTERVAADRALRQSEEVFRVLFEQSAVGISLQELPRDGLPGRARWNNRMRELLGMDADPDGAWWTSLVPGDEQLPMEAEYRRLLSGEITELRERRMLTRPDGAMVWADLSTVLVRDRQQQQLRIQTMALDITAQVEADRALRQSQAEAEQHMSGRAEQQAVLLELSRAGLEGHERPDFLAIAVELVARGTRTQFATILELEPTGDRLIRVAAYGHPDGIPRDPVPLDAAYLDELIARTSVVAVDYVSQPAPPRSQWMIERGVVASMAVGVLGPIRPFGVLSAYSDVARVFSPDDLQFMQLASTIISVAVERKRAEHQRRMLLGHLVTAQEAERKIIAEDIHDDAVQVMTAANMRLELFRMVLTDPVQVNAAQKLQETISLATGRLRNLLFQLSPPDLDRHGLAVALRRYLEQFEADAGVRSELHVELEVEPSAEVRILLFRIFQEALVNVRKHANATVVTVSVTTVDGGVLLRLSDDGAGFDPSDAEPAPGHLGLASMRERAEIAGGWWRLTSQPGHGTEVSTWVPAPKNEHRSAAHAAEVTEPG